MKDVMKYKNFIGTVHFSTEDNVFFGKIEGINDLITFEGTSVPELKKSFKEAIEDYLNLCRETGKEPLKTFKGSFNVRITSRLHKQAFQKAIENGIPLNKFVQTALEHELERST